MSLVCCLIIECSVFELGVFCIFIEKLAPFVTAIFLLKVRVGFDRHKTRAFLLTVIILESNRSLQPT